jgi:hypothetical protein
MEAEKNGGQKGLIHARKRDVTASSLELINGVSAWRKWRDTLRKTFVAEGRSEPFFEL